MDCADHLSGAVLVVEPGGRIDLVMTSAGDTVVVLVGGGFVLFALLLSVTLRFHVMVVAALGVVLGCLTLILQPTGNH